MPPIEEQITAIEEEIRKTQYNKATQFHIGKLKAKLAVLRLERETRAKGKGGGTGYAVRKSGHATVGLVGYPSTGKSTLLTALTGAASQAAAYEFTTLTIIPGMFRIGGASVQVLDMPGLIPGAAKGRGRGREVLSVVRNVDLVLFLIDADHPNFRALREELEGAGVRINTRPPKIAIYRGERGGLSVASTVKLTKLVDDYPVEIAREFGLHNGSLVFREDATEDQLIDALAGNRVYLPGILAVNKAEGMTNLQKAQFRRQLAPFDPVFISARNREGLEELTAAIGKALAFVRIYMKPPGKEPDLVEPVILREGSTVADLLRRLPGDLEHNFKAAQIWGPSSRFPGQTVGRDHKLEDTDIVTVVVLRGGRTSAGS